VILPLAILAASVSAQSWAPRWTPPADCPKASSLASQEPLFSIQEFKPVPAEGFPLPEDDLSRASALEASAKTRAYWKARPEGSATIAGRTYSSAKILASLEAFEALISRGLSPADLRRELDARFDLFQAVDAQGGTSGTITAYYDPELALEAGPGYSAILAKPADLVKVPPGQGFDWGHKDATGKLVPHFSRKEISGGALDKQGLELFYTRHPTDLLILQTEGSGWGKKPDGSRVRIAFDGANGHPFRSVGRMLLDCGLVPRGTDNLELLNYLKSQPFERERALVDWNPRYVFFRAAEGNGGPWGATGVELVAGRSIAVDPTQVPLGLPGVLSSRKPVANDDGSIREFKDFTRFIFTHDVGSAIRGPVRVDLFWGSGPLATAEAHRMMTPGRLFVFLLKP
jgi:membrane-bound lytic murein transglycosylase A